METLATAAFDRADHLHPPPTVERGGRGFTAFGDDGPTFFDILDIINPLQHIPVISTLYRAWTDDAIEPVPRIAGGALFGGLIGAASALVNVLIEQFTGRDIGGHVLALFDADDRAGGLAESSRPSVGRDAGAGADPSPVLAHVEVLEWARGERAFMAASADAAVRGIRLDVRA
ncbi:MAG: hypothetical protein ACFCUO_10050 [Rhodospirillales bacterium]